MEGDGGPRSALGTGPGGLQDPRGESHEHPCLVWGWGAGFGSKAEAAASFQVDFIWINRDQKHFEWFVSLLTKLEMEQAEQEPGGEWGGGNKPVQPPAPSLAFPLGQPSPTQGDNSAGSDPPVTARLLLNAQDGFWRCICT